ncbi:MAG: hypothetical protein L0154_28755 [Chloroflexi bacterium]|nr:hypothetical protein [Chloroflexota bacterium]
MSGVTDLRDRITAVKWEYDASRRRSHEALFKEYLRRQVLWLNALELTDHFPWYDLPQLINEDVRASTDATNWVRKHITFQVMNATMILTGVLEAALHWAALDEAHALPFDLPNPYEPMVILYERGGTFTIESMFGRFVAGYDALGPSLPRGPWRRWYSKQPFVELDSGVLDRLDGIAG